MDREFFLEWGMERAARENPAHIINIYDVDGTPLMGFVPHSNNGETLHFQARTDQQVAEIHLARLREEQRIIRG